MQLLKYQITNIKSQINFKFENPIYKFIIENRLGNYKSIFVCYLALVNCDLISIFAAPQRSENRDSVPQEGFEPPTHGLGSHCSIQLSYWGIVLLFIVL